MQSTASTEITALQALQNYVEGFSAPQKSGTYEALISLLCRVKPEGQTVGQYILQFVSTMQKQ